MHPGTRTGPDRQVGHPAMIDHTTDPEPLDPFDLEVAPRVRGLPPYLFGKINELKYRKRRDGIDVIDLGMGNPTDPPEQWVIDKLCEAAQDTRNHRYSVATGRLQPPPRGRRPLRDPVRRRPRPRPRGRRHDRVEGRVQPHVPGPARAGRHGAGPGAELPDPRPRRRPGLGQRDRARRPRLGRLPRQHRPGLREPEPAAQDPGPQLPPQPDRDGGRPRLLRRDRQARQEVQASS